VADKVVPERQHTGPHGVGEEGLLRQIIGIDVTADETATGPEGMPEDDRQQHGPQNRRHDRKNATPLAIAVTGLALTERRPMTRRRRRSRRSGHQSSRITYGNRPM